MRKFRGAAVLFLGVFLGSGCTRSAASKATVVVYVSEDRVFSEPVLKEFEARTGIRVRAVYDTEETKGTGVMNRLIAEKGNPQADVYWANEPIRAAVLKQRGVAAPYKSPQAADIPEGFKDPDGYWTGFSARARVFVVNSRIAPDREPKSIRSYTDPAWKGKSVIANPLFGTTAVHMAVLWTLWGEKGVRDFLAAAKQNGVKISTSNGESADFVASGESDFSLVDSDDAVSRIRRKRPLRMVFPDQGGGEAGTLLLPNAAVLVAGGPHPAEGKKLIDYLLSKETERKLAFADCAQIPLHRGVETPKDVPGIESVKWLSVDFGKVAQALDAVRPVVKEWVGY